MIEQYFSYIRNKNIIFKFLQIYKKLKMILDKIKDYIIQKIIINIE